MLAFETLGIVTFTYTRQGAADHREMLGGANLVICTDGHNPPQAKRVHIISHRWFEDVVSSEVEKDRRRPTFSPDTPMSDYFTFGTTGEAKHIIQTARMREDRAGKGQIRARFDQHSRFLVWLPFALQGIYIFATACARMGEYCVHSSRDGSAQTISRHDVSHISVVSSVLAKTLASLPEDYVKPNNLTIHTFGGAVGEALRAHANDLLATALFENYSSNESGPITIVKPDGVGTVLPGVEVETVDEGHRPVWGEPGLVRVKSGAVATTVKTTRMRRQECFATVGFIRGTSG